MNFARVVFHTTYRSLGCINFTAIKLPSNYEFWNIYIYIFFFRLASFPKERELMQLHCQCEMKLELHFVTLFFLKVFFFFKVVRNQQIQLVVVQSFTALNSEYTPVYPAVRVNLSKELSYIFLLGHTSLFWKEDFYI